ncbi:MAG: hypothetical protein CFH10_00349 [Alphaproteobacteria bacterium MarineAlpha4_Bin2]|mgnify:CR=1 FL=1|nr:MAG: hypothetical protein CFH10_00349 [Alphaproteobacteria bacterium MarineAlpha4_Bin2]
MKEIVETVEIRATEAPPDWIIPKRATIETVFGCNARCPMCVIENPTDRMKGVMPLDTFRGIVDSLVPYRNHFEMFDLFALGEPLLDRHLFERIRYVKSKGFKRLAFSTNAQLLNKERQQALLQSEIETVIFSLDGARKATHEKIRPRVTFERVVRNILSVIKLRDEGDYPTRFIVRFIKQPLNAAEWPRYKVFWDARTSRRRGDLVTSYNMHSWAGGIASKRDLLGDRFDPEIEAAPCHHAFDNMTILADGSMPLCAEDILDPQYGIGNVIGRDPVEVFNGAAFNALRERHKAGRKNELPSCRECTLLYSESAKTN